MAYIKNMASYDIIKKKNRKLQRERKEGNHLDEKREDL